MSPSLRYRGMKFARRNRVPLTAASLFLLVLITGAVMSTVQAIRANRNAKEAKRQYQIATNATDQATRFLTQSRHEEGKAWLERADAYLKEKNYFYAKLMAGRAIGFDGFGRASQSVAFQTNFPILLQSQSAEFRAAERVLKREPDYPLLWQSPIQRHLEGYITAIRFSRDGKNLVTISSQSWSNEVFKVWDVSSGRLLSRHELGGFGFIHVSEAAVAPNGKAVATVRGSVMSLVDLASGKETKVFKGHSDQIRAVAFSPDARKLASSSLDETLRIWDLASGRQISELKISLAKAFEMEFSVDGNVLIGNCSDGFVRGWSLTEEKEIFSVRTTEADDPGHRHLFSLSADGRQLVLVKRNLEQAAVWELPSQIELWRPEGEWKGEWTHFVGFSPRDAYLAIANGGQIKLWDLANRKPLVTLSSPGWVSVIAFSPDEKVLAAATEGGSILTWELPSGRKPSDIDAQAEVGGTPIAFSPDGTQLAFILGYGAALAELYAGRIVRTFASSEPLSALRFSPDGELLATGMYPIGMYTDRSSVQLWDSRSGALKAELNATQVLDLAFSPDAKILATLSYGGVVQLWDVGTAAEVTKLHQPDGYGGSLAFDPDGRLLAVGGVTN